MIILKKKPLCVPSAFTSGNPFTGSYSFTLGDEALLIPLPLLNVDITIDNASDCLDHTNLSFTENNNQPFVTLNADHIRIYTDDMSTVV